MRICKIHNCNSQALPGARKCNDCKNNLGKYGITAPERNRILEQQNHCCAICNNEIAFRQQRRNQDTSAAVDHCHKTGNIRGILCLKCNWGLGHFNDDLTLLLRAQEYIVCGGIDGN